MPLSTDATLAALLRTSHITTASATATSPDGKTTLDVPIIGGSVTTDATRSVRRSLNLSVAAIDSSYIPANASHPLAPYGSEITVYRSTIDPANGSAQPGATIQQGVFRITSVQLSTDAGGTKIEITGEDRASWIAKQTVVNSSGAPTTLTLTSGITVSAAINAIMDALPSIGRSWPRSLASTAYTIDTKYVTVGQDPWAVISELANAAGQVAYFDQTGTLRTTQVKSLDSLTPNWTYLEDETNVVTDVSRTLDGDKIVNGVVLVGAGSDWASAVRAEAYDTNSGSPTNSSSPYFGKRPVRVDSAYVKTQAQATDVANQLLSLYIGQPLSFSMIPNPAMDVLDVVQLQSSRLGFTANVIVDSISLPLEPTGTMSVTGRSRGL